jgi:hypothetical protein
LSSAAKTTELEATDTGFQQECARFSMEEVKYNVRLCYAQLVAEALASS